MIARTDQVSNCGWTVNDANGWTESLEYLVGALRLRFYLDSNNDLIVDPGPRQSPKTTKTMMPSTKGWNKSTCHQNIAPLSAREPLQTDIPLLALALSLSRMCSKISNVSLSML